jgi:hypothetical protein
MMKFDRGIDDNRILAPAIIILILILGIIDYKTGDYSMLVFYMIPVALGTWFIGIRFGLIVAVISGFVRLYADYNTYADFTYYRYMNVVEDMFFLLMISFMTLIVRKMLGGGGRR